MFQGICAGAAIRHSYLDITKGMTKCDVLHNPSWKARSQLIPILFYRCWLARDKFYTRHLLNYHTSSIIPQVCAAKPYRLFRIATDYFTGVSVRVVWEYRLNDSTGNLCYCDKTCACFMGCIEHNKYWHNLHNGIIENRTRSKFEGQIFFSMTCIWICVLI